MSELFDQDPRETPPPPPTGSRRSRALLITGVVVVVGFFALTTFSSIYTDRLWYGSVGYTQVFSTLLFTKIVLFVIFGVLMGAAVAASVYVAYRLRPLFRPTSPEQNNLDRYRDAVAPIRRWMLVGIAAVVGVFAGASGLGQWRSYLMWRNSEPFGQGDAYFEKDLSFYVFELPWWHYLVDFVMAAALLALVAAALVHYLYGGIRLQVTRDRFSPGAQMQVSVLLGVFLLAKGVDYWLDRYDLVNNANSIFTGMNNTAFNAVLPAKNILLGVSVICALLLFANVWRRTWQLPVVGLALFALSSVLLAMIWPAIVQQFQVKPSEPDKEESFIQANIDATTEAYNLSDVEYDDYRGTPSQLEQLSTLAGDVSTVPLVDPLLVRETFQQRQQGRAYYSVAPVLDVDRYEIDGVERPLVLGARELEQDDIASGDKNWSNLATVYTHGNGLIAAYANQDPDDTTDTRDKIAWAEGLEEDQDSLATLAGEEGYESRIYFGETSPEYSIVGKASEDAPSVELSLPSTDPDVDTKTTYDGAGGVEVGSVFRKLLYALKFGEPNFLLSGRVNENSEVLYNRTPRQRVEKVAPWLTLDSDAYPAVVDGRVLWILDGYTTTDRYPNSQRESFETMTTDSLQVNTGLRTLPTDEINYMRNAVKATVDAYDGTVTLYEWDTDDPILKTWRGAFPDTVQDKETISESLMEHLRYPEDIFKVQRYLLQRYHVREANAFYQANERWDVPQDPNADTQLQPPYRLFANQDGAEGDSTWSLTSVFVPREKTNLASFVSVDSDATSDTYGRIKVLELTDPNAPGPSQVANEMSQESAVVDALRDYRVAGASPPKFGNLLTLPVDDGLIYIEPIYAQRPGSTGNTGFPILQFVQVYYGGEIGIGQSLTSALANALGAAPDLPSPGDPEATPPDEGGPSTPTTPETPETPGTVNEQIRDLLNEADGLFTRADAALSQGDSVKWARLTEQGKEKISEAVRLADSRDTAGNTGNEGG